MVKLFLKNSNLCDHNSPTSQTDRQTDRQTTCDHNTALCTKVHRAVKTKTATSGHHSRSGYTPAHTSSTLPPGTPTSLLVFDNSNSADI